MLIGQASINLTANVLSALLGLFSVFIFTRLFAPHDYGIFLLGVGFASVISVFLVGWFRNLILSGHARNDGTDVRGLVASGYLICCLTAPIAYLLARLVGLDAAAALAAVVLAIAIGLFELTQDLLRARLKALSVMKATLVRAAALLGLGVVVALASPTGVLLLLAAATAYLVAVLVQSRSAWRGTIVNFDRADLRSLARTGLPLTLSLTLLAISSVTDRFMIANLVGAADAGKYVAALDLVRQTLMMPAMSMAAAFFPMAVQIHARQGDAAVTSHLADCLELLAGVTLPACLGFALIAPHVANIVLGADFRAVASEIMPIIAIAVLFQVLTQQYLHASFLLSGRNSFYLINTASIIAANVILSYLLVSLDGTIGAAWARLGADITGFVCALVLSRFAFRIPIPLGRLALIAIAALAMALTVGALDRALDLADLPASIVLTGAGLAVYAALCWLFDVARLRGRLKRGLIMFHTRSANSNVG
ncbi:MULTISPECIES: lipopolysaccharide biosynthesis protein [unclassified Bradyrhizobium]|uniref:lipopolysaccharide biosynthesis protein n=1 Tax=unclassified Bradyrhizobium TaxID=2631580 RepID=UPI001BA9C2DB|nr:MULTISPECIES: oligosaccharide flippase family protein [unclassified Bradyrhizobium]MBR1203242.1 oligosaccharide flippase family protein [Bradyrhizobium sp. AUGA SZCCT0124]MBR1312905.1 oligosaccharide flippase family protein [Bradyrhizobium sp. AUGA SZCCT0051]MBR1341263.1 oligosaccharide flippase family protein [Bradyrhizobium sp. AUGA SZCCT0105]MBR1356799.1 oligosaccharide flippase family protein [Bradyrhizobium sp. AUGA SZCCT0045]